MMGVVELLVVLICNFFLCVERSKVFCTLYQAMGGPLVPGADEECVAKVILFVWTAGGVATHTTERRATLQRMLRQREFDATRGYPGEDVARSFSFRMSV